MVSAELLLSQRVRSDAVLTGLCPEGSNGLVSVEISISLNFWQRYGQEMRAEKTTGHG